MLLFLYVLSANPQVALAEICAKCERYIGTEGGGMDQSISFLAERGKVWLDQTSSPSRGASVLQPSSCLFLSGEADRVPAPESHRRQAPGWGRVCDLKLLRGDEQSRIFSLQHPRGGMPDCCKGWAIPSSWSQLDSTNTALTVRFLPRLRCSPGLAVWRPAGC